MVHVNFSGTFLEPAPPLALSTFVPDLYFVIFYCFHFHSSAQAWAGCTGSVGLSGYGE